MFQKLTFALSVVCLATLSQGCASVESTMVTRDETNQHWERHNCLNGVPITLKVPTHLKLYVYHKHFLQTTKEGNKITGYEPIKVGVVVRDFAQEFMYTDKVFVVDFKRPAAGSNNLKLKMTNQYIDQIQHDVTDNTINDVRGLLAAASQTTFETVADPPSGGNTPSAPKFTPIRSLVAVGIFEIEAPDFEDKVRAFMDCHVNKSHDAWVVPTGVHNVHRPGEGVTKLGLQPLCPCDESSTYLQDRNSYQIPVLQNESPSTMYMRP
jgi:hypothetical protein